MFVYLIVNDVNWKIYVGKTVQSNLKKYLQTKLSSAKRGRYKGRSHLFNAMQKYPSTVWSIHPLISDCKTNEELTHWEQTLIKALADTSSPELRERSRSLLDELGVVAVPEPPLP